MEKINNISYITLKDDNNLITKEKQKLNIVNEKILKSKEKYINKKSKFIIDNNKKILLKKKFLFPNSKLYIKKTKNTKNNISNQSNLINKQVEKVGTLTKKVSPPTLKRNNSGYSHRNKNYIIYVSKSRLNSPNKTFNNIQGKIKILKPILKPNKDKKNNLIPKNTKIIPIKSNNNYYLKNNTQRNYNNIGIKIIQNENSEESPVFMTNIEQRPNILSNNNYNGNITYNNNVNLNFNNNKDNEILFDIPKKIFISNKEMKLIKNKFHSRSPSFNSPKIFRNISPIRIDDINYKRQYNIKIKNKLIKIPFIKNDFLSAPKNKKEYNNHSYHEITYFNTPKSNNYTFNLSRIYLNKKDKKKNYIIRNFNQEMDQLIVKKNIFNKKSNNNLINNKSFNLNNEPMFYDMQIPYTSTILSNKMQSFQNNKVGYYDSIYLSKNNNNNKKYFNKDLILSPKSNKLENTEPFMENDIVEKKEIPQKINYFGEQMLKRNKNYNLLKKENNTYNYYILKGKNNKKLKICLKKNKSNINQKRNENNNNNNTNYIQKSVDIKKEYNNKNKDKGISPSKVGKKSQNDLINKIQKNNRYSHNIINRKRMKKYIMEKSKNEEFISNSNKKENINTKINDKKKLYNNSIFDNDSINEIIKEFEKEIEEEEKKEKLKKIKNKTKNEKINISNNDSLKFSFFSDNDYSIISRDSTNNSKIKIKKKYYKTKNVDMEKNYDFMIQGIKKNKSVNKK